MLIDLEFNVKVYVQRGKIMSQDAPIEIVKVVVLGREIVLDPKNMKYNENSLGDYMSKEYGWVDYLGKQLEYAQKEVLLADIEVDRLLGLRYMEAKDNGSSEGYSKAFSTSSNDVVNARKHLAERKEAVGHIKAHLKAFDKNHENAQNRGHTLRKELDKLNRDIYISPEDATCTFEEALNEEALNKEE